MSSAAQVTGTCITEPPRGVQALKDVPRSTVSGAAMTAVSLWKMMRPGSLREVGPVLRLHAM